MLPAPDTDAPIGYDQLRGARVLVVEDEPMICLLFEDMLAELGCQLVASASNFSRACELVQQTEKIDVAILDVILGDRPVFPLAAQLTERGVPVLFCTGLGLGGLPPEWRRCGTLNKPITIDTLARGLSRALAASPGRT